MSDRIAAWAFHLEREYGERVTQCRACLTVADMYYRPIDDAWLCNTCGRIESSERVLWVPKDERVR